MSVVWRRAAASSGVKHVLAFPPPLTAAKYLSWGSSRKAPRALLPWERLRGFCRAMIKRYGSVAYIEEERPYDKSRSRGWC